MPLNMAFIILALLFLLELHQLMLSNNSADNKVFTKLTLIALQRYKHGSFTR